MIYTEDDRDSLRGKTQFCLSVQLDTMQDLFVGEYNSILANVDKSAGIMAAHSSGA